MESLGCRRIATLEAELQQQRDEGGPVAESASRVEKLEALVTQMTREAAEFKLKQERQQQLLREENARLTSERDAAVAKLEQGRNLAGWVAFVKQWVGEAIRVIQEGEGARSNAL